MLREECKEARAEGRAEGRTEGETEGKIKFLLALLGNIGIVSPELQEKISMEKNPVVLDRWFQLAMEVESIEQFACKM